MENNPFSSSLIEKFRSETPGVAEVTHLNNAGAALMPQPVVNAMQQQLILESRVGGYESAMAKKKEVAAFYEKSAQMIGADPHQMAYMTSATDAYNRALSAIPFQSGDVIITSIHDYVSNQLAFLQLKKRFGITVVRAQNTDEQVVDVEDVIRKAKKLNPSVIAITHVPTYSGVVQPLDAIGAFCREHDILFLVDGCQSIGQLPVDVKTIQCDFFSGTFRKFLRGPRGAGFLFVSDRVLRRDMAPLFVDLSSSVWLEVDHYEVVQDAKRFELWEKSYINLFGSLEAIKYLLEVGAARIAERNNQLASMLRKELLGIPGVQLLDLGTNLSSIITIHMPGWNLAKLKATLKYRNINCSVVLPSSALITYSVQNIPWAIRFSPHYYNTVEEIQFVAHSLKEIVAAGA